VPISTPVFFLMTDGASLGLKDKKKLIANVPHCTPELKGRLEIPSVPEFVNGELDLKKKCIPNELQREPHSPRSTSLDDLKDEIDELKDEVGRLKAKGK